MMYFATVVIWEDDSKCLTQMGREIPALPGILADRCV